MNKVDEIRNQLIEFNEQVGWDNLKPENAKSLASLLIGESQELWEEINNESSIGINKYDVGLEIADIYIYLQKICVALDIDMFEAIEDKMLINRARFLNDDYKSRVISPPPRANRIYKIESTYQNLSTSNDQTVVIGSINTIKTADGSSQKVYILNENDVKPEYMKEIIAVVKPQNDQPVIWIAANDKLSVEEIEPYLLQVDFMFDIELVK